MREFDVKLTFRYIGSNKAYWRDSVKIAITDKATMSNELNSMHIRKPMTLQQMRFFTIYLAKINPRNPESKIVKFPVSEFAKLMNVEINEAAVRTNISNLLEHTVLVKSEKYKNGQALCHLFRKCEMWVDEESLEPMVEFQCSEEIEPYLFELKNNFTTYEVWNTLRLRSVIHSRMYQLLKQFQRIGERVISIDNLKEQLGVGKEAYPEYKVFSRDVLKKCQSALEELTDIKFDFKAIGRPAKSIKFTIYKNENYNKQMIIDELGIIVQNDAQTEEQIPGQMDIYDYPDILTEPELTAHQRYIKMVNEEAFENCFSMEKAEYLVSLGSHVAQQRVLNKGIIGVDEANQEKIRYYREQYLYMKSYVKSTSVEVRAKYLMEVLKANVNH